MADIKAYKPTTNSLGSGQVLQCPYDCVKAKLVVREMAELLALDLVDKRLAADQLVLTLGYDIENLADPQRRSRYKGPITTDHYGRKVPKHAHGTAKLGKYTSSAKLIVQTAMDLFDRIADPDLLVRRINIVANHVIDETAIPKEESVRQLDLFTDVAALDAKQEAEEAELARERKKQEAVLAIKRKYGKNAILKAMNLEEGATTRERNNQIGGHKA